MRRLVMAVLLPTAIALSPAKGGEPPQLPPPPEPWHNDAYIGFERIAEMGPAEDEGQWYWQNALQVDGTRVKLHKQIVVCREGRVRSAEGDGGAEFFVGSLEGTPKQRTVSLRYLKCEGCVRPRKRSVQLLAFHQLAPDTIRMGDVVYSRKVEPYPAQCPVATNQGSARLSPMSASGR